MPARTSPRFLCSRSSNQTQMLATVRRLLPHAAAGCAALSANNSSAYVSLEELPPGAVDAMWSAFHESLAPAVRAGKAGPVLFQFHGPGRAGASEGPTGALRSKSLFCGDSVWRCWVPDGEAWAVNFGVSVANEAHIRRCRERLDPQLQVGAVRPAGFV